LDPFCGVGSTAVAAAELGRHFVCLDNNPEYVERARKRIEEYLSRIRGVGGDSCRRDGA
jgi:site-specific DNA-methyltransferase (adenine-specific)